MILKVLGWFFGVSFVFGGIGMLTEGDIIAGLLLLLASVFCLPPLLAKMNAGIKKQDEEKGKAHTELTQGKAIIASLVILVIAAFFATPAEKEKAVTPVVDTAHKKTEKKVKTKGEWYTHDIKISYGEMNGTNWVSYTSDQKLAISANVLAHFWTKKELSPKIMNNIKEMDDLKPYAKELVVALDEFYIGGDQQLTANQPLSESAVILLTLMKWI